MVCKTYDDEAIFKWDTHKSIRTVRLKKANILVLYSAPSNTKYNTVCKEINSNNLERKYFATYIIPGDEEDSFDNVDKSALPKKNEERISVVEDDETIAEE